MFKNLLRLTLISATLTAPVYAEQVVEAEAKIVPSKLPLEQLRTFAEIYERIRNSYVEETTDSELLENAIRGMLNGLDPHSSYLGPEDFRDLQESTSGKFGGLGLEVGTEEGFIKVITPIDDTPAAAAGIKTGDIIIKLDDENVKGMDVNDAIERMRGAPGTKIKLTIMREGENKPLEFNLKRAEISVASTKLKLLEPNFGYIRLTQFQENSGPETVDALRKLAKNNKAPLEGLVLDLRNNPGGILDAAVQVVDAFVDEGLIVYTKGRIPSSDVSYEASADTEAPDLPLVVLINGGSASASEIVAGALQDHGRAVIMGTQSFGKGSVQTVLPLNGDHALKLTTARYFTPKGRSIQAQGIIPDIQVNTGSFKADGDTHYYKEADLKGHLENNKEASATPSDAELLAKLANDDYQLYQALTLLKGMALVKPKPVVAENADDSTE